MSMSDPVADMLTRIRNSILNNIATVDIPYSKIKTQIARILVDEGFVENVQIVMNSDKQNLLQIILKKSHDSNFALTNLKRISKPSRRVYTKQNDIPKVLNGLGISILTTSKGLMTDRDARRNNVGGEIICSIWWFAIRLIIKDNYLEKYMSRIGNKPIEIPSCVLVDIVGNTIFVSGKKGKLQKNIINDVEVTIENSILYVRSKSNTKETNSYCGMTRALINNMIIGSQTGFKKILLVDGVGYRVNVQDKKISLSVGYSNVEDFIIPDNIIASTNNNQLILESNDIELLGQVCAKIRNIRKPEPYKGKGIRYDNEHIIRKAGKSAGKK